MTEMIGLIMLTRRLLPLLVLTGLALGLLACAPTLPPTDSTSPTPAGTSFPLPQTEADVPRVTVEEALTALTSGMALIVDVRSPQSFAAGHIEGAVNIPLAQIEEETSSLPLDKNLWIITYCT